MRCILTNVEFAFSSSREYGVHPLAFSYSLQDTQSLLKKLVATEDVCEDDVLYLRVAILRFVSQITNVEYGSVCYRPDEIDDQFSPNEFIGDVKLTLYLFKQEIPTLKKLKIKNIPCKRTVEFLQGVFGTYQEGRNYTPFKQYLQTTLLSDLAIEAIVDYELQPCQKNLDHLQMAMVGQESLLVLSDHENDYYNNKKMIKIKEKIDEFPIFNTKGLLYVPSQDHQAEGALSCPQLDIQI